MPPKSTPTRIRLRPQDPFDLIRLLARSQSDPRKALAELVQNSLDAGARRIDIRWFNEKGKRALRIWDDGEGITAQADLQTLPTLAGREKVSGIPEPHPIHAPAEPWRSRVRGDRWEFNTGHRDYLEAAGSPSRRLRYMVHLFAKEIVLRNFGGDEAVLERMVQVLTHIGAGAPVR